MPSCPHALPLSREKPTFRTRSSAGILSPLLSFLREKKRSANVLSLYSFPPCAPRRTTHLAPASPRPSIRSGPRSPPDRLPLDRVPPRSNCSLCASRAVWAPLLGLALVLWLATAICVCSLSHHVFVFLRVFCLRGTGVLMVMVLLLMLSLASYLGLVLPLLLPLPCRDATQRRMLRMLFFCWGYGYAIMQEKDRSLGAALVAVAAA